jgi:hypothetical protein
MPDYRIEFSVQRCDDNGSGDFTEIGFGSSGTWSDVEQAAHIVESMVVHREWETGPGMPDPLGVDRA